MSFRVSVWILIGMVSSNAQTESLRPVSGPHITRSEVLAPRGMVCTSHPLATQAGVEALRAGGSAVDAAIAANACLGLMEPVSCGIGGDLFALVWDPETRRLQGLNGSGRSPRSLTLEALRERGLEFIPAYGPLPVTVPGCVDGWFTLHARFGRRPMASNLAPAIAYARDGFPVTEIIAAAWARNLEKVGSYPNVAGLYAPAGRAPRTGERFRNPGLATTYEQMAAGGRDVFYRGALPRTIAAFLKSEGGFLDEADFENHTSTWVDPISTRYRDHEVWQLPPNGQGLSVLQMLNLLEGDDLRAAGFGSVAAMHRFIEAKKLAFADRARLYADPDFFKTPVATLASKEYAARRRHLMDPERAALEDAPGIPALKISDTVYLCAADERGMMVSWIQSNFRGMGSGVVPPGLGFMLQDRGEAFDLTPGRPNTYAPGKRPFHTIIPGFLTQDGEPVMAFGVMGGDMQPQGHVQVLVNLLDHGMSLQAAGDAPRIYHTGSSEPTGRTMTNGGVVHLEPGFSADTVAALEGRGHRIVVEKGEIYGGYQAVMWDRTNRVWIGASESRKDGQAAGY
ncbi:MAG: gamma-glutamyltransferase family protein [Verrucomicrobiae bacterium]|nr:gamma-glutamyltransferase family protein [Verrucomicrobiae bacterium]